LNTISPTIAFSLFDDRIAFGISANSSAGTVGAHYTSESYSKEYNTLLGMYDIEEENTEGTITIETQAYYYSLGGAGRPVENLTIGMAVTPPFTWEWKEITSEIEGDYSVRENGMELDTTYEETDEENLDWKISIPTQFSLGVEYRIIPSLAVAAEFQTRLFNSFEVELDDGTNIEKELDDGFCMRVGVEALAGSVPLRGGVFIESVPLSEYDADNGEYIDDPITSYGGTAGVGIPIGIVRIDLGAVYRFTHNENNYIDIDDDMNISYKKYDYLMHRFALHGGLAINIPASFARPASTIISSPDLSVESPASTAVQQDVPDSSQAQQQRSADTTAARGAVESWEEW
jgi:hypothetical protein